MKNHSALAIAARAVVDRWDSPLWKDLEHTGETIARLRDAVDALDAEQQDSVPSDAEIDNWPLTLYDFTGNIADVNALIVNREKLRALAGQHSERPAPAGQAVGDELDLIESVLQGYPRSMAQADALRTVTKLRAILAASQAERTAVKEDGK